MGPMLCMWRGGSLDHINESVCFKRAKSHKWFCYIVFSGSPISFHYLTARTNCFCWEIDVKINYLGFFFLKTELYSLKISRASTRTVVDCWYPALFCKAAEGGNQGPAQSGHLLTVHPSFCSLGWGSPLPRQEGVVCTGGLNSLNTFRHNVLLKVSVVRNSMHTKKKRKKKSRVVYSTCQGKRWQPYLQIPNLATPGTGSPSPQGNPIHLP